MIKKYIKLTKINFYDKIKTVIKYQIKKGAFLCAEENISLKVELTKKFSAGLFGGEGFILQRALGNGMLF